MTIIEYNTLREANVARQKEWDVSNQIDLTYRVNELFGEAGETGNVLKKLHREKLGIRGSRETLDHLAEELADMIICSDLIAAAECPSTNFEDLLRGQFIGSASGNFSEQGLVLGIRLGRICRVAGFMRDGYASYEKELGITLRDLATHVAQMSRGIGRDLRTEVATKFNKTTEAQKLHVKMLPIVPIAVEN